MVFIKAKSILVLFVLVTILAFAFGAQLDALNMNHWVILGANLLLVAISIFTLFMHQASIKSANPKAFINSVMVGMIVKLIVIGTAILVYVNKAGANKNVYAVYIGMLLYLVYTALEVNIALKLNKKPNANN